MATVCFLVVSENFLSPIEYEFALESTQTPVSACMGLCLSLGVKAARARRWPLRCSAEVKNAYAYIFIMCLIKHIYVWCNATLDLVKYVAPTMCCDVNW